MGSYLEFHNNSLAERISKFKMHPSHFDLVKITILVGLTLYCVYVGFKSTSLSQAQFLPPHLQLQHNFDACNGLQNGNNQESFIKCKEEINNVYVEAERKCDGYYFKLRACMENNNSRNRCRQELSNVDSCVGVIVTKTIEYWKAQSSNI